MPSNLPIKKPPPSPGEDFAEIALQVAEGVVEAVIDLNLDNPLLQAVPIAPSIVRVVRAVRGVRDFLLEKKLLRFLSEMNAVPQAEKSEFIQRMEKEEKFREEVGEHLLLLIERMEHMEKPTVLARFFRALLEGKIDYSTFQKLAAALDGFRWPDLEALLNFYSEEPDEALLKPEKVQPLLFCGLVEMNVGFLARRDHKSGFYETELGRLFVEIGLNFSIEQSPDFSA